MAPPPTHDGGGGAAAGGGGWDMRWLEREQEEVRSRIVEDDIASWTLPAEVGGGAAGGGASGDQGVPVEPLARVAGVDISFFPASSEAGPAGGGGQAAVASLVVLSFPALNVLYEDYLEVSVDAPYVPGMLAMREREPLLQLLRRVPKEVAPQLLLVDGNGVLHPRGCGLACHLGVLSGVPAVGVAKNLYQVDGLDQAAAKAAARAAMEAAVPGHFPLAGASGRVWGAALYGHGGSRAPIFVSVGHGVSLQRAVEAVTKCCLTRVPEPIRQADIRSRERVRGRREGGAGD